MRAPTRSNHESIKRLSEFLPSMRRNPNLFLFPPQNPLRLSFRSQGSKFLLRQRSFLTLERSPSQVQLSSPFLQKVTLPELAWFPGTTICLLNYPRSLSPKQSRTSFAGTVFESVNGSQQSLLRKISNKPNKTSLAPTFLAITEKKPPEATPSHTMKLTNKEGHT